MKYKTKLSSEQIASERIEASHRKIVIKYRNNRNNIIIPPPDDFPPMPPKKSSAYARRRKISFEQQRMGERVRACGRTHRIKRNGKLAIRKKYR